MLALIHARGFTSFGLLESGGMTHARASHQVSGVRGALLAGTGLEQHVGRAARPAAAAPSHHVPVAGPLQMTQEQVWVLNLCCVPSCLTVAVLAAPRVREGCAQLAGRS